MHDRIDGMAGLGVGLPLEKFRSDPKNRTILYLASRAVVKNRPRAVVAGGSYSNVEGNAGGFQRYFAGPLNAPFASFDFHSPEHSVL